MVPQEQHFKLRCKLYSVCMCVFVNLCHENSHNVGSEAIFDVGEQTNTIVLKTFNATFFSNLLAMHNLIYKWVTLKTF
jgi:hypothetical protein